MVEIISREAWGARSPKSPLVPFSNHKLTHIVAHWPGDARNLANLDTPTLIRAWQNYHMNNRGWKDIGYNFIVDQAGRIYVGRGWNVGGHVLAEQNSISVGVLFAVGNSEPMTDAMRESGAWLYDYIENKAGRELTYIGHCDWANKACPGPSVLAWVRAGAQHVNNPTAPTADPVVTVPLKTGETAPAPAFPLGKCKAHGKQMWYGPKSDSDHQVSGWFNKQADGTLGSDGLFKWQERMAYRGWKITPDGLWGDETRKVALAFQSEKSLDADGLVGPKTWAAAWTSPITDRM